MGIACKIAGAILFLTGIVLWFGNLFRFLPTFPFAGFLAMLLGGALFRLGQRSRQ